MPEDDQPANGTPAPAGAGWGFYFVPLLIVLGVGGLFWLGKERPGTGENGEPDKAAVEVLVGKDYYVLLTVMEFHPAKRNGKRWDTGGSPPDIFYVMHWRDNEIFDTKNDVAKDTLIARWFGLGADIKVTDLGRLLLPSGKRLSPRNAIQAGVITAAAGESITIEPVDDDPLDNDEVEAVKIGVMDLRVGDNVFFIDAEGQPTREAGQLAKERGGLARVVLRVVDAALPLEELVKALR